MPGGAGSRKEKLYGGENKTANPLETEPIFRLLLKYSVPTALTLMVNYLYNIVDQILSARAWAYPA